jgi:hypothetical protein
MRSFEILRVRNDPGLLEQLVDDGRPALILAAAALAVSGAFAIFLSMRREFLPQDVSYLRMSAHQLCAVADCRVVGFMFHDRVAFGGTLIAISVLHAWMAAVPLRGREAWAWWTFALSGVLGFGSFLAYLGYGYLDSWHAAATLALLPVFVASLVRSRSLATTQFQGWLRSARSGAQAGPPPSRSKDQGPISRSASSMRSILLASNFMNRYD